MGPGLRDSDVTVKISQPASCLSVAHSPCAALPRWGKNGGGATWSKRNMKTFILKEELKVCVYARVGLRPSLGSTVETEDGGTAVGGESSPVIRRADDSRCYVNIPTAARRRRLRQGSPRSAAPSNIWFSVQDWHTACVCVCARRFGADDPRLRAGHSPPLWVLPPRLPSSSPAPSSQITAVAQWLLAVAPRSLAGQKR